MKNIILASGSTRRRELLSRIGLEYKVIVSDADENIDAAEPKEMVCELSRIKALAVWNNLNEEEKQSSVVIGADTVVAAGNIIFGKPEDEADAYSMIKKLEGSSHSVYTGVTLIALKENVNINSFFEETKVSVYPMSDKEINRYIATGEPMDKAGAYGIQGAFAAYVKGINGDYNNVVGLPVARVYQELRKAGYIDD